MAQLTPTEYTIMEYVARGMGTREIANRLHITPKTLQAHLTNVFEKLNVVNRVEALVALGWVHIPDRNA